MREMHRASFRTRTALGVAMILLMLPPPLTKAAAPVDLPPCPPWAAAAGAHLEADWEAVLDAEGVLAGWELRVPRAGDPVVLAFGPRAFLAEAGTDRVLVGERRDGRTSLQVVDLGGSCRAWSGRLDHEAYDVRLEAGGRSLRFVAMEPGSRAFQGAFRLRLDVAAAEPETIPEPCLAACEPTGDGVTPVVQPVAVDAQPVPFYEGSRWQTDSLLTFRWQPGEEPPTWARPAIRAAADDASSTRRSRAPTYAFDSASSSSVRYVASFPWTCRFGIACATRSVGISWLVRLRPHGYDFSWGTLRWCQRDDTSGCFDVERTTLHELGHIDGLRHPTDAGISLPPAKTVMDPIIPARPRPGSLMHEFGACDTAALQMAYDLTGPAATVSTCLDLETRLTLRPADETVVKGSSVRLRALLAVADDAAYGELSGQPLRGRSVLLRYRTAGSADPWTTVWMDDGETAGAYVVTLVPSRTLEYQAVLRAQETEGLRGTTSRLVTVPLITP